MYDKLMYYPNYDNQNYPFCGLKQLVETFGHIITKLWVLFFPFVQASNAALIMDITYLVIHSINLNPSFKYGLRDFKKCALMCMIL